MALVHKRILAGAFAAAGLLFFSSAALAANCTAAQKVEADKQLWLNKRDQKISLDQTFPWGAPVPTVETTNERLLIQRDYVIGYDADLMGPVWSADQFLKGLKGGRTDCFRPDPRLPAPSPTTSDYDEPIFDQGHMVPNGDMTFSQIAILNTFMMSNMSPQFCQFNRGVWQILESFGRRWSERPGTLYVINGAIFDRDANGVRDADGDAVRMKSRNKKMRVAVPTHYYKIFAHRRPDGSVSTLSILLPHDQTDLDGEAARQYLEDHISRVSDIEALAGLDFFPNLQGPLSEEDELWSIDGLSYRSLVAAPCRKTNGAYIAAGEDGAPHTYALPAAP